MGTLFIVGTPIGNLADISLRALDILKQVDWVACEDTRHTRVLLERYGVTTATVSYHQHSSLQKIDWLVDQLKAGQSVALVTDAGTPGISDPGGILLERVHQFNLTASQPIDLQVIPGPSSLTAALSVAGFPADHLLFLGFLPKKKGRQSLLRSLTQLDRALGVTTIVFFESAIRIGATLTDLAEVMADRQVEVVLARELTKKFEEIWRGSLAEAVAKVTVPQKGEFVVVLHLVK